MCNGNVSDEAMKVWIQTRFRKTCWYPVRRGKARKCAMDSVLGADNVCDDCVSSLVRRMPAAVGCETLSGDAEATTWKEASRLTGEVSGSYSHVTRARNLHQEGG